MWNRLTRLLAREQSRALSGDETKEAKSTKWPCDHFTAISSAGQAVWTPRNYANLAREGFAANPIAYRAIRMISEAAASLPFLLYSGRDELERHPVLDVLAMPDSQSDPASFFEAWYGYLLISGNAYMEAVSLGDSVVSLRVLRPDRMRIVPDEKGWPAAFIYKVGDRERRFDKSGPNGSPILHLSLFNPTNDHYGMSPIEAAAVPIDVHNASAAWSKALLDNAARPSGALVYRSDGGDQLSDDQFNRLKQDLAESFSGSMNAGRPLLLEGGLDWKPLSFSAQDMDFMNTKHAAARDIALAFGVPPMLLGIPGDNTYSNYKEANLAFWRQTVLPLAHKTARALTNWLAHRWDRNLRIEFDLDQVSAFSVEREALWRRVNEAEFLSDAEKREAVGYSAPNGGLGASPPNKRSR